jgi:hypothetical protein
MTIYACVYVGIRIAIMGVMDHGSHTLIHVSALP